MDGFCEVTIGVCSVLVECISVVVVGIVEGSGVVNSVVDFDGFEDSVTSSSLEELVCV